jgi:uncharacterized protein with HEPN domain
MPDMRRERCELIAESLSAIQEYMTTIHSAAAFIQSAEGRLRLDAVALRLQVIGENVKQIAALYPAFFENELPYDVDNIIRFRDFISHHYEKLDYHIIYETCTAQLPPFTKAVHQYLGLLPVSSSSN